MLYDWLQNIVFAQPLFLGLFILVPLLIWRYIRGQRKQSSLKVSSAQAYTVESWKTRLRHLPFVLRILAVCCLVIVLARPQFRQEEQRQEGEGIDIVLCMDVSGSMGSHDIPPSRIEVAKEVAIQFVRNRPVDRIGLVIFSGESFTQCPITTDKNTLIYQIESLESRRYLIDGTVIGEGLTTAVDRLSRTGSSSKVIILLTDGKEDPPETRLIDPLTALEIAKSKNVKIYTIGMSAGPSTIQEITNPGKGKQNTASNYLDEDLLRKIANETGGKYFRARDKDGLQTIYEQIDNLEKSPVEIITNKRYEEKYLPFILMALGLLLLEIILRYAVFRKFP
ncbi:MAG TPA: VWA domain-containing protein [Chitinophagaceae bacterium]|nr:VWA domain-containing protein [Chitinophagaceae bacterium]